jgi:hypothetical protein
VTLDEEEGEEEMDADDLELAEPDREQLESNGPPGSSEAIGDNIKPFKCLETGCEKAYRHRTNLGRHTRLAHSDQPLLKDSNGTYYIREREKCGIKRRSSQTASPHGDAPEHISSTGTDT